MFRDTGCTTESHGSGERERRRCEGKIRTWGDVRRREGGSSLCVAEEKYREEGEERQWVAEGVGVRADRVA